MEIWQLYQHFLDTASNHRMPRTNLVQLFRKQAEDRQKHEEESACLLMALATLGGPMRHLKTYLTRGDLPGDPRAQSAWAYLFSARNDRAFVTTMGVDVRTFEIILQLFTIEWETTTIDQADMNANGEPQVARRSLDAAGCLGLVLHWLSSTMLAISLQMLFAITPTVCSRYLKVGLQHLIKVLRQIKHARILWPTTEDSIRPYCHAIEKKIPPFDPVLWFFGRLKSAYIGFR